MSIAYRRAIWGLSNGAIVMACGGLFWASMGLGTGLAIPGTVSRETLRILVPILSVLNLVLSIGLLMAAVRLRRRASGFTLAEGRRSDERTRADIARLTARLRVILIVEALLIALAGGLSSAFGRPDLAWPLIALILGLHFIPFAPLFNVPMYYATGLAATGVAIAALVIPDGPPRMALLGYGMALVMWASSGYIAVNAERLAAQHAAP